MATTEVRFEDTGTNEASYGLVPKTDELVSDAADDLVIALIARERLAQRTGDSLSIEDSMRALGVDPVEFDLE